MKLPTERSKIILEAGTIQLRVGQSQAVCRVVMRRGLICVGCTDITVEAAEHLMAEYKKHFCDEVVIQ